MELGSTLALLGRAREAHAALEAALERIDPDDARARADAHLRAARWYRSSLCDPTAARFAAQRGLDALGVHALPDTRCELLLIRGWAEVTTGAGDAAGTLREAEALRAHASPLREHDLATVRGFVLLAEGRLDDAEEMLVASGEAAERAGRTDMAYGGWANAACIASAAGDFERALRYADRATASTSGLPVVRFHIAGLRAYLLARLGRRAEANAALDAQLELAARLGAPDLIASADHDAGMIALLVGDHERAERLLARALEGDPPVHRAEARLRRAEALARLGRADEADAEIRAAALEPITAAHRPSVLIARMAFAQALSARARGDRALAERRLQEAAGHWERLASDVGGEHLASLVDLGRPPVTGVVDPAGELQRVAAEQRGLAAVPT
jgi:tetratricopeptide (TPR) repeat protein